MFGNEDVIVKEEIKVCTRCVMDSTDPLITFDEKGHCNYCTNALLFMKKRWLNNEEGLKKLSGIVEKIKEKNKNNKYDCMIGLSGGADSSYLAYICQKKFGLRMLALHVDTGWNTKDSEDNIKKICEKLKIDLIVEKLNSDEFMDLQRSYFLSGVPSQDIPQDHMFLALLFDYAKKNNIKYFFSGANFSTESILQKGNGYIAADRTNLNDIHRKHGEGKIDSLPQMTLFDRYVKYKFLNKIQMIKPLDYLDYNLKRAIKELEDKVDFKYYGAKHAESVFTNFVQMYFLPHKYNFDKRKSHLSSLIVTNQLERDEAIEFLQKPLYQEDKMKKDIEFILSKLKVEKSTFNKVISSPPVSHDVYKKSKWIKFRKLAVNFRSILGE